LPGVLSSAKIADDLIAAGETLVSPKR